MSTTQSPTAVCPQCGTTDVTGRFCPNCGTAVPAGNASAAAAPRPATPAPPRPPVPAPTPATAKGRPKWLPAALVAGVAAVAVAIVAVVLLAFGDDPATTTANDGRPAATELTNVTLAGQDLYAPRPGAGYVALMPAGWPVTKTKLELPLQDAVVVKSAQDASSTVTAGVLGPDSGTLKAAAKSFTGELGSGAEVQSSNPTGFSGREAWRILYTTGGVSQVAYLFDGCDRRYAVVGAAKPETFDAVSARYGIVASSMQLTC